MWQHCETELRTDGGPHRGLEPWPCARVLRTLAESNEQCLELLSAQAQQAGGASAPMLRELAAQWCRLDAHARRRAARCPFLMLDAGFSDPYRWRWVGEHRVGDREPDAIAAFFSVSWATDVARQVFNNAWHIVQTQPLGAPLYLGMPASCVAALRACSMRQITLLADEHANWLRPRWPGRPAIWRELLAAAIQDDGLALQKAQLHGVQLLATELRALAHVQRPN